MGGLIVYEQENSCSNRGCASAGNCDYSAGGNFKN